MEKAIRAIIEAHYEKCVARVVYRLRRIDSREWQGDDSPLRSLWDHWKMEMQEESLFHEMIEDLILTIISDVVDRLSREDGALWLVHCQRGNE